MVLIFIALLSLISPVIIETNGYLTCLSNCHFSQSFDSPFIISDKCNKTESNSLCQVELNIDYNQKLLQVTFGLEHFYDRKRSINEKYDYVQETTTINKTQITTNMFYSCTLEDQCERKFSLEILPKLIEKDYTNMQQKLMDRLTFADSSSLTCKQGSTDKSIECNGTCFGARNQWLDLKTGQPEESFDSPSCESEKASPNVEIMATKIPMSTKAMLTREICFRCSKDDCNGSEITDQIEKIINENYIAFYQA